MWKRIGITVFPLKSTPWALSAAITRLTWIFSLGVGEGVPQRESWRAGADVAALNSVPVAAFAARHAHAEDRRNSRRFTADLQGSIAQE
jgi:hypothetical protein